MDFQITEDDVLNVLTSHNVKVPSNMEEIMSMIDDAEIAQAALSVEINEDEDEDEIMDKQTDAAYNEIAWQLLQAGFISKEQISAYGNSVLLSREE